MDCPVCINQFNENERMPRNLPCGHTLCEQCIGQIIYHVKQACPSCRKEFKINQPQELPKNYIAIQLASQNKQQKQSLCPDHTAEVLRLYCQTCKKQICAECIISHSGHIFVKLDEAKDILLNKIDQKSNVLVECSETVNKYTQQYSSQIKQIETNKSEDLQQIEENFQNIHTLINQRKDQFIQIYYQNITEQTSKAQDNIDKLKNQSSKLQFLTEQINAIQQQLVVNSDFSVKDTALIKKIEDLFEKVKTMEQRINSIQIQQITFPKIKINIDSIQKIINSIGEIFFDQQAAEIKNPSVCYFGDRNKLMIYDIENNK